MSKNIVIMGVSGCGKTTIGQLLATRIEYTFLDADDFHPEANRQKMAGGTPLNDEDRMPWLKTLHEKLSAAKELVLACSALKASYRQLLDPHRDFHWIYLKGSKKLIYERMKSRSGHYMKEAMLDSQLATLEEPTTAEATRILIDQNTEAIVEAILKEI